MATLSQASCGVPNFSKFIISGWYFAPQATVDAGTAALFEFGQTTDGPSGIYLGSPSGAPDVSFVGANLGYNWTTNWTNETNTAQTSTATAVINTGGLLHAADAWHGFVVSGDFSGTVNIAATNGPSPSYELINCDHRLWLAVDDVDYSDTTLPADVGGFTGPPGIYRPGWTGSGDAITSSPGGFSLPALTFPIAGLECGLPVRPSVAGPSYNGIIRFADFRMWVGQSLNLSIEANRRLFISSALKRKALSVAETFLGEPDIKFVGNAGNFVINGGTAGDFIAAGSISNVDGPSE